jgi:hypothetical protein
MYHPRENGLLFLAIRVRLDMDVGRLVFVRLDNDLTREPYDRGIVLVNAIGVAVESFFMVSVADQLAQRIRN